MNGGVRQSPLGLRQLITLSAVVLGLVALGVSTSLVVLTTSLHDTADLLRENVRGVRLPRETQVDLFRHERSSDPAERADIERSLRDAMAADFGGSGTTADHRTTQMVAKQRIDRYLAIATRDHSATASEREATLADAVDALDPIVHVAVAHADDAQARAERLDQVSNTVALSGAAVMLVGLAAVALWTRRSIVLPIVKLSDAVRRFGSGDLSARAEPRGPLELRRTMEQFNVMGADLERQRRERLTHLAGVAHDLRNPLAALQMSAALVDAEAPLPPEPLVRRTFALVRRQVGRLDRMVGDFLDATRIDSGHLELVLRRCDLREAVGDVVALFHDVSPVHHLEVALPDEALMVSCDAARIEQALTNLVSNAIKYSPHGGHVRVVARRQDDRVLVSVADEGIGIGESEREDIWQPFRRTGLSKEAIPGVGLGLWTARKLVEAHGGELTVDSVVGRGSTFTLALPRERAAPRTTSQEPTCHDVLLTPGQSHG